MAAYLDYQAVYCQGSRVTNSWSAAFVSALILFAILAIKVAVKLHSTSLSYSLAQEQQQAVDLDTERRDVELQRSVLLQAASLEKRVHDDLELLPFNLNRIVRLSFNAEVL